MERNHTIDTLRTIATLMVILIHVVAGYVIIGMKNNNYYDTSFWIGNILDSFSRICVPLFVLISGRFLIGRCETFKQSYMKRTSRIFIPLIAWTLIYLVYRAILGWREDNLIEISTLFKLILLGKPFYHMWYLYMLIGLYLVTPILNNIIPKISRKNLWISSGFLLLFGIINNAYNLIIGNDPIFILWFVDYLGYFMLGFLLKDSRKKISSNFLLVLFLLNVIIISILSYYTMKNFNNLYFYGYLSPFVVISSVIFYKLFDQINLKNNILSRISHLTFGIYLIHALILNEIDLVQGTLDLNILDNPLFSIFMRFSLTLIVSTFIAYGFSKFKFFKKII